MNKVLKKTERRAKLKRKIRATIFGTQEKPRLSIFRSNKFISAQIIDDEKGLTLASANDIKEKGMTKTERAELVGKKIAEEAKKKNITNVVFDRNGFSYAGRVQKLADSAREGGLKF